MISKYPGWSVSDIRGDRATLNPDVADAPSRLLGTHKKIYGLNLPIIAREELIAYKKILARHVDLVDVKYLERA